jgi:hypothetical protein
MVSVQFQNHSFIRISSKTGNAISQSPDSVGKRNALDSSKKKKKYMIAEGELQTENSDRNMTMG